MQKYVDKFPQDQAPVSSKQKIKITHTHAASDLEISVQEGLNEENLFRPTFLLPYKCTSYRCITKAAIGLTKCKTLDPFIELTVLPSTSNNMKPVYVFVKRK